jgi:hypothetical protein
LSDQGRRRNSGAGGSSQGVDVRALALTVAVALLAVVAPAAQARAPARWSGTIPLPGVESGAIDDRGRTVVGYPSSRGARLVRLALRGAERPVAVPDVTWPTQATLLADGTTVGVGSHDVPPPLDAPWPDCCQVPVVFRPPASGGATQAQEGPRELVDANWGVDASAVAPDGTVTMLAAYDDAITSDQPIQFAVATLRPGDPSITLVRAPFRASRSTSTSVRALSGGRAAVAWRGNREIHVLTLRDGTPIGERAFRTPFTYDEHIELDGRGRAARVGASKGRLWLWAEGRGRRLIAKHYEYPDTYMLATGPRGEAAVAFTHAGKVRVVAFDAGLRRRGGGAVTLGRKARVEDQPFSAIDARGGVHIAWPVPGGGVAVHGPAGTHRLRGRPEAEVVDLAVSPAGRELVLWQSDQGTRSFAAVSAP